MNESLRDRIEEIIADHADADGYGGYSARNQAQAVIDDLGLEWKHFNGWPSAAPHLRHIVGRLEKA